MRPTFVVTAAFAGLLTLAASSTTRLQKRSFAVKRVANPHFAGRNGPMALAKAYRKFGVPLPRDLDDAVEMQERGLATSTDQSGQGSRGVAAVRRRDVQEDIPVRIGLAGTMGDANSILAGLVQEDAPPAEEQLGAQEAPAQEAELEQAQSQLGAGRKEQTGAVAAVPEKGQSEYLSEVRIGGQKLKLDFDTGSSDLWVFNAELGKKAAGHDIYDAGKSKGFRPLENSNFKISYGDGSGAEGNVGTDIVSIGGASVKQAVQLATNVSGSFLRDQNSDGLLGLAFSKLNTVKPQKQRTFFDNIKNSLDEPLFTADLRGDASGTYTFGYIDKSKFQGDLTWVPVNNSLGFWQFSSEKFAVGGGEAQPASSGGQAIADTGTTLILADQKIVDGYYSQVSGVNRSQQGITFPCGQKLPDLDLDVGGLYMARVSGDEIRFAQNGDGTCFGGLQVTPPGTMGIYGDVFFRSQLVVFHGGNNSLGMAAHA